MTPTPEHEARVARREAKAAARAEERVRENREWNADVAILERRGLSPMLAVGIVFHARKGGAAAKRILERARACDAADPQPDHFG